MTGADKEAKAMAGETYEERSSAMKALATEVEVIKADNPKATHTEIADRLGFTGSDRVERVEGIIKSDETKDIKNKLERRAAENLDTAMATVIERAKDPEDPKHLDAVKVLISMANMKQTENTINVVIDNRSVSIPYNRRDWGVKKGEPYHLPTWEMALKSDDMAHVCRTQGCAMVSQGRDIGKSLFEGEENE